MAVSHFSLLPSRKEEPPPHCDRPLRSKRLRCPSKYAPTRSDTPTPSAAPHTPNQDTHPTTSRHQEQQHPDPIPTSSPKLSPHLEDIHTHEEHPDTLPTLGTFLPDPDKLTIHYIYIWDKVGPSQQLTNTQEQHQQDNNNKTKSFAIIIINN